MKHEKLMVVHMSKHCDGEIEYSLACCDMSDHGWVKVGDASVTVTLLDYKDVVTGQIDMLNEAKKRVQAEAEKKLTEIEGQIQSLLAIEYKPCVTTEG